MQLSADGATLTGEAYTNLTTLWKTAFGVRMVLKDWTAESEAKAVAMHSAATVVHIECALGVGRTSVLCEVALGQGGEPKSKGKGKYKSAMEFAIGAAPPADDHAKYYEQAQARLEHQRAARFGVPWAGPGGGDGPPNLGTC